MRVALMTSAKGWRGSSASYAKLARGLAGRGHLAHLITTAPGLTARFLNEGLPVAEIAGRNTGPREVRALLGALRRLAAEVILVDTPRDLRISAWATLFHNARVVYRYNLNYRRPRIDLADRLYSTRVAACVFQSEFIRQDALRHEPWVGRVPGYRVPNGYDTVRFAPLPDAGAAFRRKWDIPAGAFVVLTAAKLTHNKGHEVAIEALHRVGWRGADLIYVICGDGPREPELRALVSARELPARFTGLLDTEHMVAALSAADLVLHPSLQEIFPNAVGEAMSCARAVVAADAGGTGELLGRDGSTGILVPPDDAQAMAAAVTRLLDAPDERAALGARARRRIEAEFPLERMIEGYEAALRQVIARGE
jgi:glycosyltransferase involved in cell wall biosynthesis